ncbi:MAG: NAD(P)/FAD-dependent oxidoreductase [Saprospiraceae bacterium]
MFSYWEQSTFFTKIDLAIIGSGIVGLNAAITYKEQHPEAKVIVLERGALPSGASTKNAGFACFGSMTELLDDIEQNGAEQTWKLVEQRWRGLQRLRSRVGDENLQFEQRGGYELFRAEETDIYEKCLHHVDDFNEKLVEMTGVENVFQVKNQQIQQFDFQQIKSLIHNVAEGQIHTGRMMQVLLKIAQNLGIEIYNGFAVERLENEKNQVVVFNEKYGNLLAKNVLIATNGFARQLLPELDVQPARNQVLITEPIPNLKVKGTFHYDQGYFYFRNIDNRMLLGGGRQLDKTGEMTTEFGTTDLIQNALRDLLNDVIFPNQDVKIAQWWSGILGVGQEKKSIVRQIEPNIYAAVRMGGMGIAIGTLIGENAAKMISI